MPSNIKQINRSKSHKWIVGDSKMDELINYLNKIGFKEKSNKRDKKTISSDISS